MHAAIRTGGLWSRRRGQIPGERGGDTAVPRPTAPDGAPGERPRVRRRGGEFYSLAADRVAVTVILPADLGRRVLLNRDRVPLVGAGRGHHTRDGEGEAVRTGRLGDPQTTGDAGGRCDVAG